MAENNNKFILYEYLLYFGRKKKYFILIPFITTLLIMGLVYMLKGNEGYNGKALVFTGSIDSEGDLTDPDNLEAEFGKINPNVEVFSSGKNNVKITLNGDSKAKVNEDLDEIVDLYYKKLVDKKHKQMDASVPYKDELEKSYEAKEEVLKFYQEKLKEPSLSPSEYKDTSELILETQKSIAEEKAIAHRMRGIIGLFEKPEVLSTEVSKSKTYLKESIIAGLLLGFVLTFAFLILLKYIEEARRYYKR